MEEVDLYWIRELELSIVGIDMARSEYNKILWSRLHWNRSLVLIEDLKKDNLNI